MYLDYMPTTPSRAARQASDVDIPSGGYELYHLRLLTVLGAWLAKVQPLRHGWYREFDFGCWPPATGPIWE